MTFLRRHMFTFAAPLLAIALMATPAQAKPGKGHSNVSFGHSHQQSFTPQTALPLHMNPAQMNQIPLLAQAKVSAGQAKSIARKKHPKAKFVDIARKGDVYVVRLIKKDGRVVDVFVDAMTGRVK